MLVELKNGEFRDIPDEIVEAATKIDIYFHQQGIKNWELCNICSRNFAYDCRTFQKFARFCKKFVDKGLLTI